MAHDALHLRIAQQSFTSPTHRVPNGGLYQPDQLAAEIPPNPDLDETPDDPEAVDIKRVARRLVVAFLAIAVLGILNYTVLYRFDATLHPAVLLGAFGIILAATILSTPNPKANTATAEADPTDCGCPVGMCSGPRPIGELSRKAAAQRNTYRPGLPDR